MYISYIGEPKGRCGFLQDTIEFFRYSPNVTLKGLQKECDESIETVVNTTGSEYTEWLGKIHVRGGVSFLLVYNLPKNELDLINPFRRIVRKDLLPTNMAFTSNSSKLLSVFFRVLAESSRGDIAKNLTETNMTDFIREVFLSLERDIFMAVL